MTHETFVSFYNIFFIVNEQFISFSHDDDEFVIKQIISGNQICQLFIFFVIFYLIAKFNCIKYELSIKVFLYSHAFIFLKKDDQDYD